MERVSNILRKGGKYTDSEIQHLKRELFSLTFDDPPPPHLPNALLPPSWSSAPPPSWHQQITKSCTHFFQNQGQIPFIERFREPSRVQDVFIRGRFYFEGGRNNFVRGRIATEFSAPPPSKTFLPLGPNTQQGDGESKKLFISRVVSVCPL